MSDTPADAPDFEEAAEFVAAITPRENGAALLHVLNGVPHGRRVIAELADQPEEAAIILGLPPTQMVREVARFAARMPAPASKAAPKPAARPVDLDDADMSMADWARAREAQVKARGRR